MTHTYVTRDEARKLGLKRYYQGDACRHGHYAERYTSSGTCVQCVHVASRQRMCKPGTLEYTLMVTLEERGPMTFAEILDALPLGDRCARNILCRCRHLLSAEEVPAPTGRGRRPKRYTALADWRQRRHRRPPGVPRPFLLPRPSQATPLPRVASVFHLAQAMAA